MLRLFKSLAVMAALLTGTPALAQDYPSQPIHLIVGFAPGGGTDSSARLVAQFLEKSLGQSVVVENKPGASGAIGAKYVMSAKPDGYTLFFGSLTLLAPAIVKEGPVVAGKDLAAVSRVNASPFLMFARADLPINTWDELLKYSQDNPGSLNMGMPSAVNMLVGDALMKKTGLDATQVAYKGAAAVATGLLSGEVDITVDSPSSYVPHVKEGKLKALFVASDNKFPLIPDAPTAAEAGIDDYRVSIPIGIWAPLETPIEIRTKIADALKPIASDPAMVEQFSAMGSLLLPTTPEELQSESEKELEFWTAAAKGAGYEPQ